MTKTVILFPASIVSAYLLAYLIEYHKSAWWFIPTAMILTGIVASVVFPILTLIERQLKKDEL